MVLRTLIVGTLIFCFGAFYALREDGQARTFFVVMYAIFAQDRELLFESPTVDDAAEEIARRHSSEAAPAPEVEATGPVVRDFTRRESNRRADVPPAPRFGN